MDDFAKACQETLRFPGRLKKIQILSDYLAKLEDSDLARAIQFLLGKPATKAPVTISLFETIEAPKLRVARKSVRDALQQVTGWDDETLRICYREVGDSAEAASLLLAQASPQALTLAEAEQIFLRLHARMRAADQTAILADVFRNYAPLTIKFFLKVLTGGFRIGLQEKMLEDAVAAATGRTVADVRSANNRLGDLAAVALAARHDRLSEIPVSLFHPMDFMLAKPLESVLDLPDPSEWVREDKFDGMRAQVHLEDGRVQIYTRGLEEVTTSYPEITDALRVIEGSAILDGEILAWRDGRALPFAVLQQRLQRKLVSRSILMSAPVVFMAYDILYRNGRLLLETSFEARRAELVGLSPSLQVSEVHDADSHELLTAAFDRARERGNEGLILKRRGSRYEAGKRSLHWLKLKKPFATLDCVITAAEQGHGKRATVLSDYTFAVRTSDGQFVNIGKAYSGLTDAEIREMTQLLKSIAISRYSRVLLVRPEVVLEVAFDGIQRSPRHKSGYALRFPRIARWRTDKKAEECDTLDRVVELYESSLNLTAKRDL